MLLNFRFFSLDGKFVKLATENDNLVKDINSLTSIEKIMYYDCPIPSDKEYLLIVKTSSNNYLYNVTKNDIDALSVGGIFIKSLKPEKISVVPLWFFGVAALIILCLPSKKTKQSK